MPISSLDALPEAFVSETALSSAISRGVQQGKLRKLGSRLYTRNFTDAPEDIVRRNLWQLVGAFAPGALIADRTALENAPASDGSIFLIADRKRDIDLPGVTLRPRPGHPPLSSDRPFIGGLFLSSTARSFLENMRPSRGRGGHVPRTLTRRELEERLDSFLRRSGPAATNQLRDELRALGTTLELEEEARDLSDLIGTLLGTRDVPVTAATARARKKGRPFDPDRIERFQMLHKALREHPPVIRLAKPRDADGAATLAFFEAYFSNFIEGTEFAVEEAADIIFRGFIPTERPADAHDVLGTYRVIADTADLSRLPTLFEDFLATLRRRHAAIMDSRPDKSPGSFKQQGNQAGSTVFVAPDLVEGTLEQGFPLYRSLEGPFARAVFMMFLVSEVHPFADGNGRVARVMMNAELIGAGEERIVIPTVYRNNYLAALKALTQSGITDPLVRTLDYAQRWTAAVEWNDLNATRRELAGCHAFMDPGEAEEQGIRLRLPSTT
jgi:hypothetical protein